MLPKKPPPPPDADPYSQLNNKFTVDDKNGGWWFSDINKDRFNMANLNGRIQLGCAGNWPQGMIWNLWYGAKVSMKSAHMKILPIS